MAWPEWMMRGYVRRLLRSVADRPLPPLVTRTAPTKLALITSCGLYLRGQDPFDDGAKAGDPTFRSFPVDTPEDELLIAHPHYEHDAVRADVEVCLPRAGVRALIAEGKVSALHDTAYSFMGFFHEVERFLEQELPPVVDALVAGDVEAALLTPC